MEVNGVNVTPGEWWQVPGTSCVVITGGSQNDFRVSRVTGTYHGVELVMVGRFWSLADAVTAARHDAASRNTAA